MRYIQGGVALTAIFLSYVSAAADDTVKELLKSARVAWVRNDLPRALELTGQAIDAAPNETDGYELRALLYRRLGRLEDAVADYDAAIKVAPRRAELYEERGSTQFRAGKIEESIADYDRYLAIRPDQEPFHWQRGISYYYAGHYEEGRKQFEGYQTVDNNDVENAVWRFLCMARSVGVEKARAEMLKVRDDPRVPMKQIYELYRGDAKPEDVLHAATETETNPRAKLSEEAQREERLFYSHLYLGLYYEITGDAEKAAEHIFAAEKNHSANNMRDVAHVHAERLRAVKTAEQ